MVQKLRWMGTDQQYTCSDQQVGLVQCTLDTFLFPRKILGPIRCSQTGCIVAADIRLDNRPELLAHLEKQLDGTTLADSEILLAAYLRWGEQTPQHLLGDFAFAIWDPRHQYFFCARDHMGVRPLYYLHQSHGFALASHPAALLALPGIETRINEQHLACFLLQILPQETDTFYQSIQRLPPGHSLKVYKDRLNIDQYWSPLHVQSISNQSFSDNADQFRELFIEAVRCRILESQPIASTLSGGLDSSSITCVAARLLDDANQKCLHTFSAIFPSIPPPMLASIDERRYKSIVQEQSQSIGHDIRADELHPFMTLEQDLRCVGQPFFGPNMYMHNALFERAAGSGIRIFLDGIDGDSVLSYGFELFPSLLGNGHWWKLLAALKALKKVSSSRQSLFRLFATYAAKPLLEGGKSRMLRYRLFQGNAYRDRRRFLQPSFCRRVHLGDLIDRHYQKSHLPTIDAVLHHRAFLALHFLAHILETQAFFSARHSLSMRFPFLDHRLVSFCLSLPPEQKMHQGWSRAIQRRAMTGLVPDPILQRLSKSDLSSNYFIGLQTNGFSLFRDILFPAATELSSYLDVDLCAQSYAKDFRSGQCSLDRALFLYSLVNVATWLRQRNELG